MAQVLSVSASMSNPHVSLSGSTIVFGSDGVLIGVSLDAACRLRDDLSRAILEAATAAAVAVQPAGEAA